MPNLYVILTFAVAVAAAVFAIFVTLIVRASGKGMPSANHRTWSLFPGAVKYAFFESELSRKETGVRNKIRTMSELIISFFVSFIAQSTLFLVRKWHIENEGSFNLIYENYSSRIVFIAMVLFFIYSMIVSLIITFASSRSISVFGVIYRSITLAILPWVGLNLISSL